MNLNRLSEFRGRWGKAIEGGTLLLLLGVKLWMISELDIVAVASPHDNQWMVNKAAVWYWGDTGYSQMSHIKEPLMPLFLAFSRALGVPARLGLELLLAFSAWMLCRAIPAGRKSPMLPLLRILVFSAVLFFPPTAPVFCLTVADPLTICLAVLWLGIAVRLVSAPAEKIPWALLSAWALVSVGLASARPEIEWVAGSLLMGFLCWLGLAWATHLPKRLIWRRLAGVLATAILFIAGVTGVKAANYFYAGFWGISEQTEPNYRRALMALRSVPSGTSSRYVWINNPTLKRVAAVSPAVAEVEPFLTGPLMEWVKCVPAENRTDADAIAPGYFIWALRDAVYLAGRADSADHAAAFYRRMADEIAGAQKAGLLPRRSGLQFYLGHDPGTRIGTALRSFAGFLQQGFLPDFQAIAYPVMDPAGLDPQTLRDFDEIAGRRIYSSTARPSRIAGTIRGWFMETGSGTRLREVAWGQASLAGPQARPDVGKEHGWSGPNQRWGFLLKWNAEFQSGDVIFVDETGREYPINAEALSKKPPGAGFSLTSRDGAATATCWIDSGLESKDRWEGYYRTTLDRNLKLRGKVGQAWPWLICAAAAVAGVSLVLASRPARLQMLAAGLMGLSLIGIRYAILTIVDVWYISAHELRYSSPADILVLPLLLLMVSLAATARGQADRPAATT